MVITDCIRQRFMEYKDKNQRDFDYTERLRCIKCNHKEPLSSIKCVMDLAKSTFFKYVSTLDMKNSKEKYVICSQKDLYKADLRRIPGVPLIYFNRSVLTLDTPSKNSHHAADSVVMSKLGITKDEKKEIGIRKEKREERSYVHVVCGM